MGDADIETGLSSAEAAARLKTYGPNELPSPERRDAARIAFDVIRLDDKKTGAIVIVMQRVHIDDLTGFVLDQSEGWEVLSLPAIAEVEQVIPVWGGWSHHRKVGEVLSPERFRTSLDKRWRAVRLFGTECLVRGPEFEARCSL